MLNDEIKRLTNRHIAKLLAEISDIIPAIATKAIKTHIRHLEDDIRTFVNEGVIKYGKSE